ncbi:hypothetical protein [Azospirillum sp. ST 5-10]|uniref:hypothetical protein n=1 Tax=unclassified Azospirillum TaxID=2630922 RepID=UPI003F4A1F4C
MPGAMNLAFLIGAGLIAVSAFVRRPLRTGAALLLLLVLGAGLFARDGTAASAGSLLYERPADEAGSTRIAALATPRAALLRWAVPRGAAWPAAAEVKQQRGRSDAGAPPHPAAAPAVGAAAARWDRGSPPAPAGEHGRAGAVRTPFGARAPPPAPV